MKYLFLIYIVFYQLATLFGQSENPSEKYIDSYKQYLDAPCPLVRDDIRHYVYFGRDRQDIHNNPFLKVSRFEGAQIMYSWRELEPEKDQYDFTMIREDYEYLKSHGKKLFIQLQDATFSKKYKGIPVYLFSGEYDGGSINQLSDDGEIDGWVAKRWNPEVQKRFALLMQALGQAFDDKVEGVNLQESAIGVNNKIDSTFTPEQYVEALKTNMLSLKKAFPNSTTMQYANFMPGEWLPSNDKGYLRSIYEYGEQIGVGLGGPDLMFKRLGNLNHTVAMMHEFDYTVPLGIAIQDGNYIGTTGSDEVKTERENMVPLLHAFAKDFLKVKYMFWVYQEPYFSEDVIPCFVSDNKFED